MAQETTSTASSSSFAGSSPSDVAAEILALLGHDPARPMAGAATLDGLRGHTRDQLLDFARRLGLTGVAKLTKDVLAGRIHLTLERILQSSPSAQASRASADPARRNAR